MAKMIADNLILDGKCTTQEFWASMNSHTKKRLKTKPKKNTNYKPLVSNR